MTVRDNVLRFLRTPRAFADDPTDSAVWRSGLAFAQDAIAQAGEHPLRPAQVAAWEGLADARAGLILGPPGTGKTHLLAWLILGYAHARQAAGLPCRILVSAFTLNAIGNVVDAVARRSDARLPAGPAVRYFGSAPGNGLEPSIDHRDRLDGANSQDAIADLMGDDAVVVGASVWSVYRLLESGAGPDADGLTTGLFDLVCIDEASQMVVSHGLMTLAALKEGGRLVVAGDDRQLRPVRAGREVNLGERELGGSLYSFLKSGAAPEFPLDETFRLNAPLAAFPERKFYPGAYRSAVPSSRLALKDHWQTDLKEWERTVLDPQWPICVLLHDGPPAATSNDLEADLAVRLLGLLTDRLPSGRRPDGAPTTDLWNERLAVVSPHRAQNALIKTRLPDDLRAGAFVETVDRIQGKERDAVLLSYCVADSEFALAEGEFIFAPERLNVAITRARTKLIVLISRRLLDAVPTDQAVMDQAEILREFVFGCRPAGAFVERGRDGRDVSIQLRVCGFAPDQVLEEIKPEAPVDELTPTLALTPALEDVLSAVRTTALGHPSGGALLNRLRQVLARGPDLLADLATLHTLGFISLRQRTNANGTFWIARPLDPPRQVYGVGIETVRQRLEETISQSRRGSWAPTYENVRDRFAWPGGDGTDRLWPAIEQFKLDGLVKLDASRGFLTIDWLGEDAPAEPLTELEPPPALDEADFDVLNDLESLEAERINFGVFEAWTSVASLADATHRLRSAVTSSLSRLAANGWVLLAEEGRVRSRMAELARELRYVKQRFAREDADRRPYLVRALKVEMRDRDKPQRSVPLAPAIETLAEAVGTQDPALAQACRGLGQALTALWSAEATIAGFQHRALDTLVRAWAGDGPDTAVIAADTGSGKTEAAAFPLMVGATAERLKGRRGVKAILAYPRVRLATNQAQRLASYLAALAAQPGMPVVTLGLQLGQVPENFERLHERELEAGWSPAGDGRFAFPFFACPACDRDLILSHGAGAEGADSLSCGVCDWRFDGWIGSKRALRATPPDLFLPTTDSLHQWLHDTRYGALFGDDPAMAPPRAILADEIHLYSHIHGAQVGLALRRVMARAELNGDGRRVLTIGMSATLGDPARAWGLLVNRSDVATITPEPSERVRSIRGREYFFFVQPEVESRGQDIAGASTTIQALMCLAHGMRRRTGSEGGFRSLVFLDSIDKVRRLHGAYTDAEESLRLAAYRTRFFVDESSGHPRDGCCGEPSGCDPFRNGECWWFAAKDERQCGARGRRRPGQPLKIAEQPVSSAATGRIEGLIKDSDVVFATSSLEVGYDDPDITLVYQHYAPQNLASFIQRKGRGGRGADDRPITGVTLSLYSSRDTWWFRKPHEMISPKGFEVPLNPDNHFVRRGQVLATALDGLAQHQSRTGELVAPRAPSKAALVTAAQLVEKVFGPAPWREFDDCASLEALWTRALARARFEIRYLRDVREAVDWIPTVLFETINLPQLHVDAGGLEPVREDIALALATAAPGNASRRFDPVRVMWRPPVDGRGPWLDGPDYARGLRRRPFGDTSDGWLSALPISARPLLEGLSPDLFRPGAIKLETLGRMHGVGWQPDHVAKDSGAPLTRADREANLNPRAIKHDSQANLRGFPIVKPNPDKARPLPLPGLEPWIAAAEWFKGESLGGKETGLAMARVYWAADGELRLAGPQEDAVPFTQVFTGADGEQPLLHGYHVQTEGVRFHLDAARLDAFVTATEARLATNEAERRWHAGQMLRYLVESGAQAAGVNGYEARRGAELIVSAAGDSDLRKRLTTLIRFWSGSDLASLLEDTRAALLSQHPLLSARRTARVAETLADPRFGKIFGDAVTATGDPPAFRSYLKSVVVHSLAQRLKASFVHVGRGDERQVVMHTELPIQFGADRPPVITICEAGAFGDGTTRAFVEHLGSAIGHWRDGFIARCPNAQEDAALSNFFSRPERHSGWRSLDPNDTAALAQISAELDLPEGEPVPSTLLQILFGSEAVGIERFDLYDVAMELQRESETLHQRLRREPTAWELTSSVVASAREAPDTTTGRLLQAYAGLEDASLEDSLSADARLADQVFRLGARLCVDGCQACVHQGSDLMSQGQAEATTSRRLLCEFVESTSHV